MTASPILPKLIKAGIVLLNPDTGVVERVITLQYNPETLSRTLQMQSASQGGDRSEALRLTGPPIETYKLEAEIDATDQLEFPDQNRTTVEHGIYPQLAALEMLVYPPSERLQENARLADAGMLEIVPVEAPLTLFVWSKNRVLPVRLTEFSITEEFFDPVLNPIRAKVSVGFQVLSINDLPFAHRGASLFMAHHRRLERLAKLPKGGTLGDLGITEAALEP
jgi:Contractile injection system tube protein